ncbi:zinc ribbon domain-containing protein [Klebsiella michiganensis]|uniref:zinc ribbon domain-containing protein n=1 Tax=Klebsiella michiganensis TaxID=1134687 RepID=UPI001E637BD0|nr:zinc ribbon domain-containing protein [Klebsiella michiganensis]WFX49517.1 zinc ribbon domain-containing protein [Klebsiella michiganensis]WFX55177.1 zinc ribbon domain-containing protein [Klebsiella michiganensis]
MELIIICAIIGCIPAAIASGKGRSFFAWWVYGALLFIVALIHSLVIKKDIRSLERSQLDEGLVKCPFCAETIKPEAVKCKHCGSNVKEAQEAASIANFKPSDMPFDAFFIRRKDSFEVNEVSVTTLVSQLKKANPGIHPMNIKEKYSAQITELVNQLPSGIRDEFLRVYDAKF